MTSEPSSTSRVPEKPSIDGLESRWVAAWEESGIYRFDRSKTRDAVYSGYAAGTSMQTFIEAEDIGNMAVFLASDAARYVSGQVIAVDGHTVNPDPQL